MIPSHLIGSLAPAANLAINRVLRTGAVSARQRTPSGEVGFVAAVVLGGVPAIAKAWRPILRPAGYSVSMTGIFCHQTPRASFIDVAGKRRQCELADLLMVAEDLTGGAPTRRWAVLIQAKMTVPGVGQSLSSLGDLTQLELLSHWPPFTLPSGFAPGTRNFTICPHAGKATDCGQYGLIDPQPSPLWHQQAPAKVLPYGGNELGTFLARMVESGQIGYGREATGTVDDWSRTVDELMKVTAGLAFNYAVGFGGPRPRGNTSIAFSFDRGDVPFESGEWYSEPPPPGGRQDQREDGPSEGINLLRIGVSRIERDDRGR